MEGLRGTYAILLYLGDETRLEVGKLGSFNFPGGCYLYLGSALGGILPRVNRHLQKGKKLRWHIDYLSEQAEPIEIWYSSSSQRLECLWCELAAELPGAQIGVEGFGCSDCKCRSHLLHFPSPPSFDSFRNKLRARHLDAERQTLSV